MNSWYIAKTKELYGSYGNGPTAEEAIANMKKAHKGQGRIKKDGFTLFKFTSELPFAPRERTATDGEADAWCGKDGSLNWVRCEREILESVAHA